MTRVIESTSPSVLLPRGQSKNIVIRAIAVTKHIYLCVAVCCCLCCFCAREGRGYRLLYATVQTTPKECHSIIHCLFIVNAILAYLNLWLWVSSGFTLECNVGALDHSDIVRALLINNLRGHHHPKVSNLRTHWHRVHLTHVTRRVSKCNVNYNLITTTKLTLTHLPTTVENLHISYDQHKMLYSVSTFRFRFHIAFFLQPNPRVSRDHLSLQCQYIFLLVSNPRRPITPEVLYYARQTCLAANLDSYIGYHTHKLGQTGVGLTTRSDLIVTIFVTLVDIFCSSGKTH